MKAMKLIKILTIFNFLGLIIVFVACRTGVLNDVKTPKVKSEIKNETDNVENEIDEADAETKEIFFNPKTIMVGSKSGLVVEKEEVFDFNYLIENIIENNLKLMAKGKTTPNAESKNKKKNRETIPSSKSGKIFSPKQENK